MQYVFQLTWPRGCIKSLIMPNPLVQVAERLRSDREEILRLWEESVRREIPEAKGKDTTAIRNSLPDFLDKVAHTLSSAPPKLTAELESELVIAREHGKQRVLFTNYTMEQVIHEYQLLRKVTLAVLEKHQRLNTVDRDVVLDAISLGERIAATSFHRIQLETLRDLNRRTGERDAATRERDHSRGQVSDLISERDLREIFVSSLAHDLRTPITAARMNLELLFKRRNDVGALEIHAGRAIGELSRLEGMIRDLLDANRIQAGEKLPVKLTSFELCEEVQRSLDTLASLHGDRFEFEPAEKVEGFWDKKGIRRIVDNLCTNAIKYGNKTTPIGVCVIADHDTRTVELSVQNFGPVIPEEDQAMLFRQFHRAKSAESQASQGWGIGLALVRGMAEAHGGSVRVESSARAGTVFTVRLPIDSRSAETTSP